LRKDIYAMLEIPPDDIRASFNRHEKQHMDKVTEIKDASALLRN
jgi:hypothetical protein